MAEETTTAQDPAAQPDAIDSSIPAEEASIASGEEHTEAGGPGPVEGALDIQAQGQEAEQDSESRSRELEAEVSRLHATIEEQASELANLREQVASAAKRYRSALLTSAPEVPEELIQGETVAELDQSLVSAKQIVEKIASQLEAHVAAERVPSGAPPRREADLSALSPREKILYALQRG